MFKEEDHPRGQPANKGQFIEKVEGTKKSGYDSRDDLNNIRKVKEATPNNNEKAKSKDKFFGEEFKGYKGEQAIEKLLKEKRGHIKNAFERPEIGGIDLVWGDEKGGLLHTIQKRDRLFAEGKGNISGLDMVKKIPEIIEKGKVDDDKKGRINIDYDGYRVGVMPTFFNERLNWIVTAMELF